MTKVSKSTKEIGIPAAEAPVSSKLDRLLAELAHEDGATLDQLAGSSGWQKHSVRGAMAGALKRKGHHVASTKVDGVRRYRLVPVA